MCPISLRVLTGLLLVLGWAGCAQPDAEPARAVTTAGEVRVAVAPPGDACDLLSDGDIQRVFPDVGDSRRDRKIEVLGMARCDWGSMNEDNNVIANWQWTKPGENARQRVAATASMFKGFNGPEQSNLRFEPLSGMGDEAMLMIEAADELRGVLSSFAVLVIRHGDQWVELRADPLAERERADALAALTELGRVAARRLDAKALPQIDNQKESP